MSEKKDEQLNEEESLEEVEEQLQEDEVEVESELEKLQSELDELKDKYARVYADFDNVKKRLEKEKYQAIEYANEKFAKDMIPVLDSLEGALKAAEGEAGCEDLLAKMKEGIELTYKLFLTNLEKHGVEKVSHEEPFDPNIHNAVQSVDHEEIESGEIVQTFQTGYKYKGRPLREAMVVVAN
ncbi:Heat shock protein GrpE [hydrothermal vent metagenome]|uniref:Heat shock protein GrpE n=1 Tax=hydrothermal vent metagenome TaxID=652676 RepID=A0A1W1BYK7_9ZZZZ